MINNHRKCQKAHSGIVSGRRYKNNVQLSCVIPVTNELHVYFQKEL